MERPSGRGTVTALTAPEVSKLPACSALPLRRSRPRGPFSSVLDCASSQIRGGTELALHDTLAATVADLRIELPVLTQAAAFSEELLENSRAFLRTEIPPDDKPLDVVFLGSPARREASPESDIDYLVIAHGLPPGPDEMRNLLARVDHLIAEKLLPDAGNPQKNFGVPGSTGTFGRVISAPDLTERIGLEQDTNVTHTHRILILEESASVYQPERLARLKRVILERYLADYEVPKVGVPRFLLNDVLRYWRTVTVDYQAKRWRDMDRDWGLRFLKLLVSRKLAFAGALTSLFLPALTQSEASADFLEQQFSMPPLARLAQLHTVLNGQVDDALRTALQIAENFAAALQDGDFRTEAKTVQTRADMMKIAGPVKEMRDAAAELQDALEGIFFGPKELRRISTTYLSF
jgi:predicted nucleotidyltransferase